MQKELPNLVDERRFRRRDAPEQQQQQPQQPHIERDEYGRVCNAEKNEGKRKEGKLTVFFSA